MKTNLPFNQIILYLVLIVFLAMSSCASRQDLIYFQDEIINDTMFESKPQQLVYKPDDLLVINIAAADSDAASPFNLPVVANNIAAMGAQAALQMQTYLIDYDGNIEFPVLGTIKMAGLTRTEATVMLKNRIAQYADEPIVNIRLANFTVTILGEVNRPGTFTIQDERITLVEALGLASDLTIFGKRTNVLLIREIDNQKRFANIDLTSINAVKSPLYYLQQNDVIIVEPNRARIRASTVNQNNFLLVSAIGTLTTVIAVFLLN